MIHRYMLKMVINEVHSKFLLKRKIEARLTQLLHEQ